MDSTPARGMTIPTVRVLRIRPEARQPQKMSVGASGWDLSACTESPITIEPGAWAMVPTGIALEIPRGFEGQVRARSGLAARMGIGVLNGPGTIDSDYRGEICVILMNWGRETFTVRDGDRIAQLVFSRVEQVSLSWSDHLSTTDRGEGGFGHTGLTDPDEKGP